MLEELYKNHYKFCNILKKLGCCKSMAEDFVQDMYLKVHVYSQTKDIKNAQVLAYFILRNLYFDYYRKKTTSNIKKTEYNIINSCYIHDNLEELHKDLKTTRNSYKRTDPLMRAIDADDVYFNTYDPMCEEFDIDEEIRKSDQLTQLESLLNDPLIIDWYDKKILLEHYKEGVSMRRIGRETNIGFPSIYNTVKKAREQLRTALNERTV